jgi:hypothetical protein
MASPISRSGAREEQGACTQQGCGDARAQADPAAGIQHDKEEELDACPIFLQVISTQAKARCMPCMHLFCRPCLMEWTTMKHSCALCRVSQHAMMPLGYRPSHPNAVHPAELCALHPVCHPL